VCDYDVEKLGILLKKNIIILPKHVAIEPKPPACDQLDPKVQPASFFNIRYFYPFI
jgi:hypothetical protein